jgi:hypothetical protein
VLGVVVAGEQYGDTFKVCIARDKCKTHWREVVEAKEKAAKLREKRQPRRPRRSRKRPKRAQQDRSGRASGTLTRRAKPGDALEPHIIGDAVAQVKGDQDADAAHADFCSISDTSLNARRADKHLGKNWFKTPVAALLVNRRDVVLQRHLRRIREARREAARSRHQAPRGDPRQAPAEARGRGAGEEAARPSPRGWSKKRPRPSSS